LTIDLKPAIARILSPNGATVGTGLVASDAGARGGVALIATCAHVVRTAGAGPGDKVRVVFHATGEEREVRVEPEWWRDPDAEDVAILCLEGPLPEGVTPLDLGAAEGSANHPFRAFGYPVVGDIEGLWATGEIKGLVRDAQGRQVLQLASAEIDRGISGGPVLDETRRRIVGMVTATYYPDGTTKHRDTGFATPTETLRAVCPELQLSDICPYQCLAAFTEDDTEFFFGRERVVKRLAESLRREPRFLAVLGPSGSGKSSLVRAGLIPQLRQGAVPGSERWGVIVARPADQPFGQLEAGGLAGASEGLVGAVRAWLERHPEQARLVLVVDQFEELLVTCPEPLRRAFTTQLTGLLEASLPITVVLVMRDDFYGRFARQSPALLGWLERGLVNVPPTLARDELWAIVEDPALAVGLTFEAGLVEAILEDAMESAPEGEGRVGRSTVLPLLEFALTQLWKRRRDGALTHDAYGSIGGVTGGLTQWADRAFYGLEEEQQWLARRILTDLVHLGDESQGLSNSRRRRPLDALCRDEGEREAVHGVVRRLADARLLVTGRDLWSGQEMVELIHDALLREWGLLQGWLRDGRRFLAWRQALEGRVQAWVESAPDDPAQQDAGWLLRGRELTEAERWLVERGDDLRVDGQGFIQASISLRERDLRLRLRASLGTWQVSRYPDDLLQGAFLEEVKHYLEEHPDRLLSDEKNYIRSSMTPPKRWKTMQMTLAVTILLFSFLVCVALVLTARGQ
jgi:energy-coupling factor transporter ATP-binding protein EcfA2